MLDIKRIKEDPQAVKNGLRAKEVDCDTHTLFIAEITEALELESTPSATYDYYHKKNKVVAIITISCAVINVGLNYVLIRMFGVVGAALATTTSHLLQLTMHHIYASHILGKEEYPYPIKLWCGYALCFGATLAASYLLSESWLLRWGIGAAIGLWELWRIKKRKSLL